MPEVWLGQVVSRGQCEATAGSCNGLHKNVTLITHLAGRESDHDC